MKVKPVMDALEERGAEVILVHTGQHYDPAMSEVFFADSASAARITSSGRARAPMRCRPAG